MRIELNIGEEMKFEGRVIKCVADNDEEFLACNDCVLHNTPACHMFYCSPSNRVTYGGDVHFVEV